MNLMRSLAQRFRIFLPVFLTFALLFAGISKIPTLAASANPQSEKSIIEKVENGPNHTRTVTLRDSEGRVQLAVLDCENVPDLPGFQGLCGVLDTGFEVLGSSITGALGGVVDTFFNSLTKFIWGRNGLMEVLIVKGTNFIFRGIDPLSSADQQSPSTNGSLPMILLGWTYQNSPNLQTSEALAELFNHNILGLKTSWAQAATPGRSRLTPIFGLWEAVRNIAYVLIVIILVIYGVMVMLRYRVDPRTVVTAQSALPRLALSLIFITFSYTIAAFVIDLMQVLLRSVAYFYQTMIPPLPIPSNNLYVPFLADPLTLQNTLLLRSTLNIQLPDLGGPIPNALGAFVINFALWYMAFHLFFSLIQSYARIFIYTIIGPALLALGIIPSRGEPVKRWISQLLAAALVFPAMYFLINLAVYFNQMTSPIFMPDPLTYSGGSLSGILILGILTVATRVPNMLEEVFDIVPGGHGARGGVDVGQAARRAPFVGGFIS